MIREASGQNLTVVSHLAVRLSFSGSDEDSAGEQNRGPIVGISAP